MSQQLTPELLQMLLGTQTGSPPPGGQQMTLPEILFHIQQQRQMQVPGFQVQVPQQGHSTMTDLPPHIRAIIGMPQMPKHGQTQVAIGEPQMPTEQVPAAAPAQAPAPSPAQPEVIAQVPEHEHKLNFLQSLIDYLGSKHVTANESK